MLRFKNVIVSESSSIDKDTGNVSIFNIFNNLSVPAFPVIMNKIVITVILERSDEDGIEGNIELIIKQKNVVDFHQIVPYLFKDTLGANLKIQINGFVIKESGVIEIIVKHDDITNVSTISVIKAGTKI
jgi:hypothetical protein